MKCQILLVLPFLVSCISGFVQLGRNEGQGFPDTFECEDDVDTSLLPRRSINVNEEGVWFRKVDAFAQLPQTGGVFPGKIICIEVIDTSLHQMGGYVTRISGGVGERSVKLHLKSQRGRGLKFRVTAYYKEPPATKAPVTPKPK